MVFATDFRSFFAIFKGKTTSDFGQILFLLIDLGVFLDFHSRPIRDENS